jgi:hypothetical protein
VKLGFATCTRHEPRGVGCALQSVHSQFLPAKYITPVAMTSSRAYAREEINTRRVIHVANIRDRTSEKETQCKLNEDLTLSDRAMQEDIWAQLRVRAVKGMRSRQRHLRHPIASRSHECNAVMNDPRLSGYCFVRLPAVFFRLWTAGR